MICLIKSTLTSVLQNFFFRNSHFEISALHIFFNAIRFSKSFNIFEIFLHIIFLLILQIAFVIYLLTFLVVLILNICQNLIPILFLCSIELLPTCIKCNLLSVNIS